MPPFNITEHKPMEEEMRKLSSAIEQSIDGVAIADLEPKLTYVNDAFARMHGYSREEMMGMKVVNLHNEEQMDEYQRSMNQIKTQGSWEGKIGRIRKDGTPFATYMSVSLLKGDDGKPKGIAAVATDITERKPAEEAPGQDQTELERRVEETLKDSEPKFKTIVENIRDVVFQLSPLGMIQYVSPKVQEVYGYKPEDLVGKHLKKTTPVRELPKTMKILKSAFSGKAINNFEINQRDAKGKIIPMEINAAPVRKEGKIIAVQGIMRDITKRKQAEEELRESEARNRSLVNAGEHMGEAIFLLQDTDKVEAAHLFANEEWTRITGYTTEELRGTSYYDIIHPRHRAAVADRVRRRLQQGQDLPGRWEISVIAKDGTEVPIEVGGGGPITYHGKLATVGYARDITERKRMEEELRKAHDELEMQVEERTAELTKANEELRIEITERKQAEEALADEAIRQHILIDQSRDGIVILDKNGKVYEANQQFAEMLGYSPKEVAHLHVWDWDTQWPREQLLEMIRSVDAAGAQFQTYHRRKDGTVYDVEISTNGAVCAGQKLVFCVCRDITERKQMEEVLRKTEQEKAVILNSMSEIVVYQDTDMKVLWINRVAGESVGVALEQLAGRHCYEIWHQRSQPCVGCPVVRVRETGQPQEAEMTTPDGRVWFVRGYPIQDANGGLAGIVEVTRDITERKRAEEVLRAANKELREAQEQLVRSEKLAAIGQLAGGVGHELRNPLGAIKNAAYYVKGKVAKSELAHKEPRVIEFLNIMDDEINNSNQIINDLLGFSRVAKPSVSPTQIKDVIEDALSRTTIPESIKLIKKLDTELPQIEIDASQIHQVLMNLVNNAVQAMTEGGRLTIAAREKESYLEVEIADTGCGIPEEAIDKIFDPLFTTRANGIGLGLAVCKTIIDRHEGKIEVMSQGGKGTTFTIRQRV